MWSFRSGELQLRCCWGFQRRSSGQAAAEPKAQQPCPKHSPTDGICSLCHAPADRGRNAASCIVITHQYQALLWLDSILMVLRPHYVATTYSIAYFFPFLFSTHIVAFSCLASSSLFLVFVKFYIFCYCLVKEVPCPHPSLYQAENVEKNPLPKVSQGISGSVRADGFCLMSTCHNGREKFLKRGRKHGGPCLQHGVHLTKRVYGR